jgi:hypothetical protein
LLSNTDHRLQDRPRIAPGRGWARAVQRAGIVSGSDTATGFASTAGMMLHCGE